MVEEQTREAVRQERRLFFNRLAWYRRRLETLEAQAVIDDLTGLRNQRALWRELTRRGETAGAHAPLALVMLDFDMLAELNDRYGHAIGDAVLRRAAGVLRESAPSPRLAFRYGGEEFVLLLPGDAEDARALAEDIRTNIAAQNGRLPAVTVSCGVAEFAEPVEPWVALDRADAALRAAKRAGRNRVIVAGDEAATPNAYLVEELEHETARRAALALAVAALNERDRTTADHSDDVLTLCESLGRRLGFEGRALEHLLAGAQLHDVGKVAVPTEILNKPGPLNEHEWAVIREHTVIGERILRSVPEMAEVATIVRHSHERFDGGGYPDGLVGEQIPLASRVILCADAFHAVRSDRPYREGRPAAEALEEIRAHAGTQLDPRVVDALVDVAEDVRGQKARGTVGSALPRNRRLIALLATLAIGSGSAVAGIPDVREAIKSLFGADTAAPDRPFSYEPGEIVTFGPLGELLSIEPTVERGPNGERVIGPRATAGGRRSSARAADRRSARGGSLLPGRGIRDKGPALARSGRKRTAPQRSSTPPRTGPTQGGGGGTTNTAPTSSGDDTSRGAERGGNGQGHALGRSVPTPRRPAEPPRNTSRGKAPADPGRDDPPALGRELDQLDKAVADRDSKGS